MSGTFRTDIGGCAENQDRAIMLTAADGGVIVAVFDGHGPHGSQAAQWAADWLTAHPDAPLTPATFADIDEYIHAQLIAYLASNDKPHTLFGRAIYTPGYHGTRGLPIRGGTTMSVAHVSPDGTVCAAHVGDSDIHVFDDPEWGGAEDGVSLTADHTPTSRAEYERIRVTHPGTQFICVAPAEVTRPVWVAKEGGEGRGVTLNPLGPFLCSDVRGGWGCYLRTPDDVESLAMTRSLGDFNLQLMGGVSIVPHCQELPAPAAAYGNFQERVVIVASDGFWDILHHKEVADVIWNPSLRGCDNAEATADALLALAKAKTIERLGAPGDNITVAVVRI